MDRKFRQYLDEVKSEIDSMVYSDGEGAQFEDKFTEYCLEFLEQIQKTEAARPLKYINPNSQGGIDWKINGYALRDWIEDEKYFETLDLFITWFRNDSYEYNISADDFKKSLNQIKRFISSAIKRHIDYIDGSNSELTELIKLMEKQGYQFDRINVFFLINGSSNHDREKLEIPGMDIDIFVQVWDMQKFHRINESTSNREPIELDFGKLLQSESPGLQSLKVPVIDEKYDCFLAIVPGNLLANLYKEHSSELLESNVRAFLGQTGKYNKGIRDTIREKPQMFLPYNNGITATAESVETEMVDNVLYITHLNDFQIVNGGQTTASLYHTQKKYKDADLSKIFVQMKLTVIKDEDQKNIEVPNISRYANSQNKVTELDLSSNNPYLVRIENLSRKQYVVNPANTRTTHKWFFERTNGQYRSELNKLSPTQQKAFSVTYPKEYKFIKSDVAKFINLWELEPNMVSLGSQKNFNHYIKKIDALVKKNAMPGENFYKKLIANAVLFKTADKLFGRKGVDAIGDTNIKSMTVAYTVSFLHYLTHNRLDLWKIYTEQQINEDFRNEIKKVLVFVHDHLVTSAGGSLISEYAKKPASWERLKSESYSLDTSVLDGYMVSAQTAVERENEKETAENDGTDDLIIMGKISELGLKFFDGLKNIKEQYLEQFDKFNVDDIGLISVVAQMKNDKPLNATHLRFTKRIFRMIEDDPSLVETALQNSKLENKETVDFKGIHDRMKPFLIENWKTIEGLQSAKNMFEYKEFNNLKTVYQSVTISGKKVNQNALLKAYESLQKLGRFGLKI